MQASGDGPAQERADIRRRHGDQARVDDVAEIEPRETRERHIPQATDELHAVVQATEEATGVFLDAAEEIERLAADCSGVMAAKLGDIATRIYEASTFQDIAGQRIAKVVGTLRDMDTRTPSTSGQAPARTDDHMLNGPALPASANSQEDVDALLASLD